MVQIQVLPKMNPEFTPRSRVNTVGVPSGAPGAAATHPHRGAGPAERGRVRGVAGARGAKRAALGAALRLLGAARAARGSIIASGHN